MFTWCFFFFLLHIFGTVWDTYCLFFWSDAIAWNVQRTWWVLTTATLEQIKAPASPGPDNGQWVKNSTSLHGLPSRIFFQLLTTSGLGISRAEMLFSYSGYTFLLAICLILFSVLVNNVLLLIVGFRFCGKKLKREMFLLLYKWSLIMWLFHA